MSDSPQVLAAYHGHAEIVRALPKRGTTRVILAADPHQSGPEDHQARSVVVGESPGRGTGLVPFKGLVTVR
ncbi:hypothetical protein [Actinoallomurus vinaceus]|uniref:hypothetical protein n=1 Tax=Actinoallomurus vinaceus TaxID=1080074 RepID=UPI0031EAB1E1